MLKIFKSLLEKYFIARLERPKSTLGFEYPKFRDNPLHPPELWLESKKEVDGAEGLWRIEDDLYDFSDFIDYHPGGRDWLELTKGTDITEAFEIHHFSTKPRQLLDAYFVRKATTPRLSPFTFEENGFYKTLKRHVKKELDFIPEGVAIKSQIFADVLILAMLASSLTAVKYENYIVVLIASFMLALSTIAAHNFFHQKDNFRMYYFDFSLMDSRNWRITHAITHHIFPNTIYDWEISNFEPFLQFLPIKKNFFVKYVSWLYVHLVYAFIFIGYFVRALIFAYIEKKPLKWTVYIPLAHFTFLYIVGGKSFFLTSIYYVAIIFIGSFIFGAISLNVSHHHPDLFHDGDEPRMYPKIDWGIYQLDTVIDKPENLRSPFLGLVSFGDHALHHLFPTLDHGKLAYLYPIFEDVCKQFDLQLRIRNQYDLIKGLFQLLATDTPKKNE